MLQSHLRCRTGHMRRVVALHRAMISTAAPENDPTLLPPRPLIKRPPASSAGKDSHYTPMYKRARWLRLDPNPQRIARFLNVVDNRIHHVTPLLIRAGAKEAVLDKVFARKAVRLAHRCKRVRDAILPKFLLQTQLLALPFRPRAIPESATVDEMGEPKPPPARATIDEMHRARDTLDRAVLPCVAVLQAYARMDAASDTNTERRTTNKRAWKTILKDLLAFVKTDAACLTYMREETMTLMVRKDLNKMLPFFFCVFPF